MPGRGTRKSQVCFSNIFVALVLSVIFSGLNECAFPRTSTVTLHNYLNICKIRMPKMAGASGNLNRGLSKFF